MNWTVLESKMLSAAAYDAAKQILYLRFRNTGDVYRYFDLPAADHQAFLSAESKGRFFRYRIRDYFRYERRLNSTPPDHSTTILPAWPPSLW